MIPKFRAWEKAGKRMVLVGSIDFRNEFIEYTYSPYDDSNRVVSEFLEFCDVVLMQSTGLFDKNGVEIFEGDIVRMHSGELLPVKLHHGMFEPVCYYASRAFGRVGNVFENPELLEHPDFREG
ncbi:YopX family protein [Streptococcus suis]|uniref:YopX family protein n=1 Tax=Streptococcus suis TaxID=1307 RepID=UPI001C977F1E|nr:YopX family protein [Streptococcus suis]MBY4961365.1 YopX family protein [Streptococcus suis]MBY4967689.1 YopX family protein [Streptococcus suis]MBY4978765.1 YopX family protein [Streptococcus suis]MBY4987272.1 YopX family protein [Streptococcus suis]MBY4993826.1 YopX family protein [Streptococcus suis]